MDSDLVFAAHRRYFSLQARASPAIITMRAWFHAIKSAIGSTQVRFLLGLTFSQIGVATIFYNWIEQWPWPDALYFSVITIATAGYGDFSPKTDAGKLFTIFYIMFSIGIFVTSTATLASQILTAVKHPSTPNKPAPPS